MSRDPIVEEVRKIREAYAAQFNFDLEAMSRDLKERERNSDHPVVSLLPKRIKPVASD